MKRLVCACAGLGLTTLTGATAAEPPQREGFTMELGIGAAYTAVSTDLPPELVEAGAESPQTESHFGLAPLSLSLGGFASSNVSVSFRAAGTSYFVNESQIVNNFYGGAMQYWVHDRVFLGGGVGLGVFGSNAFFGAAELDRETGLSFMARLGTAPVTSRDHGLILSLDFFASSYKSIDTRVYGLALNIGWQMF